MDTNDKNRAGSVKNRKKNVNRKRTSKKRQQRVDIIKKRIGIVCVIAIVVVLAVFVLPRLITALRNAGGNDKQATQEVDASEIRHLSFDTLSINGNDTRMSVDEFKDALSKLYNAGYVLVDVYEIAHKDETGTFVYSDTIKVPQGKKPLIISQQDVSYGLDSSEGTANKLVLVDGEIKAQYTSNDKTEFGDYDIVPILEAFIEEHPDFSYDGARAILGVSGSEGVLGYRTTSYFSSSAEDNPYASYGTFDTKSETESAKEVADELKAKGYRFASCGFDSNITYGAEYSIVEEDVKSWSDEVKPVVGETNLILLPRQTDIASWKGYTEDNNKYKLLLDEGFRYYFVGNASAPFMLQTKDGYVRQSIYEVFNQIDFANALAVMQ